jgi:MFS transporter, SHS family, lactate transporter
VAFSYMLSANYWVIVVGYVVQGALLGGGAGCLIPTYMSERFPTEVRATASAFCYHQGAIFGGLVAPVLAFFAVNFGLGYAIPMLLGTVVAAASVVVSLLLSPETKDKVLVAELSVA